MATQYFLALMFLLTNMLLHCTSAAVHHSHNVNNLEQERESDGSFRGRDFEHYGEDGHNSEFDHEAILGSVKEAEEFDRLSPEESKERLAQLLPKMDLNGDKNVDRGELKKWILKSFINLSLEEAQERMQEADDNQDGLVSWPEYLRDSFGVDTEEEVGEDDQAESGMMLKEEKAMWAAADTNGDNSLDLQEFQVFSNPEEHDVMHPLLLQQSLREKDKNQDGQIDFQEYLGDRASSHDKEWLLSEREKFEHELDVNKDGVLDEREIHAWVIPNNDEIAEEEVDHLFASADDDHDELLSYAEVAKHHDVFVGSEATDYGNSLMGEHFDDEL